MESYTNTELRSIPPEAMPTRGTLCEKCRTVIPEFADLTTAQREALREMASRSKLDAIKELRHLTGCGLSWAKIWVSHPNGPQTKHGEVGPPCSHCGTPLRTHEAKQCLACGMDWHDPNNIIRHKHCG